MLLKVIKNGESALVKEEKVKIGIKVEIKQQRITSTSKSTVITISLLMNKYYNIQSIYHSYLLI